MDKVAHMGVIREAVGRASGLGWAGLLEHYSGCFSLCRVSAQGCPFCLIHCITFPYALVEMVESASPHLAISPGPINAFA